jgi:RHS repeat-associated protein
MANSQITSHSYDPAGRETALTNTLLSTSVVLSAHTATYDPAGNKVAVSETITGEGPFGLTYTYDPSNQLLSEQRYGSRPYSNTFTYDPAGNQLSVTAANGHPTTNTYNAANGLILSTPGTGQPTTVSYDLAGNRLLQNTGGALTTFTWDYENRNTLLVPSSGAPLTNLYDATGLRRFDGTDSYIWDQQNVLQVRTASTGAKYYQFTNSPGAWGGLVSEYEPSFGSSQFYAFDQSGNTRVATHKPGDVTSTVDYTAFGTQYYLTGGSNLPFRFGGKWGYYMPGVPIWILYIQQRWLDVLLAQWTSRDLIGFDGGDWNLCRYVQNNPLIYTDPIGAIYIPFLCTPSGTASCIAVCRAAAAVAYGPRAFCIIEKCKGSYVTFTSVGVLITPLCECEDCQPASACPKYPGYAVHKFPPTFPPK